MTLIRLAAFLVLLLTAPPAPADLLPSPTPAPRPTRAPRPAPPRGCARATVGDLAVLGLAALLLAALRAGSLDPRRAPSLETD